MSLFRVRTILLLIVSSLLITACGGGGGGGSATGNPGSDGSPSGGSGSGGSSGGSSPGGSSGGSSPGGSTPSVTLGANQGQALLGPIVDATVTVYEAENFNGTVVCTVMTSSETADEGPGVIDLSSCLIEENEIYYLVVSGGMDIDADDNGVLDTVPTAKNGELRAIISGQNILDGDFRINIVTELAYQSVSETLLRGGTAVDILPRLNNVARQLLKEDLNSDGVIDNLDLLEFSPVDDSDAVAGGNSELLDDILAAILSGDRSELTNLSRQFLLASTGEINYRELVDVNNNLQNFVVEAFEVENGKIFALGSEADSPEFDLKVLVIDVSDFSNPILEGQLEIIAPVNPNESIRDMVKIGNYMYIAFQGAGLYIVDLANPAAMQASLHFQGSDFVDIEKRDSENLYIGSRNSGLDTSSISIVNISTPDSPIITGALDGPGLNFIDEMLYADNRLYVPRIGIYDASTPASLPLLAPFEVDLGLNLDHMAFQNGFLYIGYIESSTDSRGVIVYDVREPNNRLEIQRVSGGGQILDLRISNGKLYALAYDGSEDISTKLITSEIFSSGKLRLADSRSTQSAFDLQIEGDKIYVSGPTTASAYDINALNFISTHLDYLPTSKTATRVEVVGDVAFVVEWNNILVVDISSIGSSVDFEENSGMEILDNFETIDGILDLQIVGNYAYLANATEGISIIDISDPLNLELIGSNSEQNSFVINPDAGPEEEILIGGYDTKTIAVSDDGSYAYTITGVFPNLTLDVYSVLEPTNPTLVGELVPTQNVIDLAVKGNYVYGVISGELLLVFDVSNPSSPVLSDSQNLKASIIELVGDYLYTSSTTSGLSILYAGNSSEPVLFGGELGLGIGNAVHVVGNIAYVANEFGYIEAYDISDKTNPEFIATARVTGTVEDVYVTEDYVFAVNGFGLVVESPLDLQDFQ